MRIHASRLGASETTPNLIPNFESAKSVLFTLGYAIRFASLARRYATMPAARNLLSTWPMDFSKKTSNTF